MVLCVSRNKNAENEKRIFNFVNTMRIGFYKIRDNGYVNRLIGICFNIWKENHNMSALIQVTQKTLYSLGQCLSGS